MRLGILSLLALLLFGSPSFAACGTPPCITTVNANSTSTAIDTTGVSNPILIALSWCYVNGGATTESTPSDSAGNTWHYTAARGDGDGSAARGAIYYAYNPTLSASHTFTLPPCASGFGGSTVVGVYSGAITAGDPLDQAAKCANNSAGLTVTLPALTPTVTNTLLISGTINYCSGAACTDTAPGFTVDGSVHNASHGDETLGHRSYAPTTPITVQWTDSAAGSMGGCVAAFRTPSSGGGGSSFVANQSVITVGP